MGHKLTLALLGITLLFAAPKANAQAANAGDIRGTATDSSGALLPDVTVTLLNTRTGVSKELITNKDGLYDSGPIVTGNYTLTFAKAGFANFVRSGLNLDVATVTVNGQLKAGGVNQEVVVNTDVPLIETETGEQSATLGFKEMEQLPNVGGQGPSWENFTTLIPGATGTASAPLGKTPGQSVSVNGNLPYSSVLADGAVSTLSHSGNADVNVFETIQEVKISSSAFSAQYGIGGIIFNQITKGGTNNFHGSLYEYNQNDVFNARPYDFSTSPVKKNRVRFNNFGGSVGGPVWKDKAFFFFNYDQIINNSASSGYITVPTVAQRNGDFSQELVPGLTCQPSNVTANGQGTPGCIYDPATQTTVGGKVIRQPFAGNVINRIDPVAKAIQTYYPAPNVPGNVQVATYNPATGAYTQGVTTNNYYYQVNSSNPYKKYFGRFDYDVNEKNRITASVQQRDNPAFFPNQGICPINCYPGDVDSTNAQITDVANISSSTVNEARIGYTKQLNFYIGQTIGQGYPAKVGLQFAHADAFPTVNVSNYYALAPGISAIYKEHVFDLSDVLTMIRGRHIMHFGGEFLFYEDNSTAWGNINAATVGFTGTYTRGTVGDSKSGFSYADFLLGQMQNYSSSVSPEYAARQKSPQIFFQDDFKIRPNLTLNLGIRYQVQLGWHDAKNNQKTFDPTVMNPATKTLGGLWYEATKENGRTQLQQNVYSTVLPRVGFAYTARPNFVIRGGYGLYAYDWSLDTYGSGQGDAFTSSGNTTDQTNGVTPVGQLSGSGAGLPFNAPSTSASLLNGQGVNYNPYHTPVAKIHQYNLAVEQQIGSDIAIQVAYVGSHGFDLAFPSDINQVPEAQLAAVDAQFHPFVQYKSISGNQFGAISNYNSLQLSFTKRLTRGVSFSTNYVWSKFLDEADSSGWGSRAGTQVYQRAYDFRANYGPSNFDVRHAWKGDFVYNLPFGKGARFLNNNWFLDEVIGGWRGSGTFILNTGNPFTPTVSTTGANDFSLGGNGFRQFPNLVGNPVGTHGRTGYFNQSAYLVPKAGTFGNAGRNSLVGPGFVAVNASLGKTFHVYEALNLSIRADANNILNHPNFGQPNTNIDTGGAAITSISGNMRNMQLSARFAF